MSARERVLWRMGAVEGVWARLSRPAGLSPGRSAAAGGEGNGSAIQAAQG